MREILLIVLALAALGSALRQRAATRRTLRRLDEMLAQAMNGTFAALSSICPPPPSPPGGCRRKKRP